jgi:hypothetical protein
VNITGWLIVFAFAAGITVFNTMLVAWIAHNFVNEEKAKFAGFAFVLGGLFYGDPVRFIRFDDQFAVVAGAMSGLVFVFCQFFKREVVSG